MKNRNSRRRSLALHRVQRQVQHLALASYWWELMSQNPPLVPHDCRGEECSVCSSLAEEWEEETELLRNRTLKLLRGLSTQEILERVRTDSRLYKAARGVLKGYVAPGSTLTLRAFGPDWRKAGSFVITM